LIRTASKIPDKKLSFTGFTLLELMVVVAVIAILAVLALPSRTGEVSQIQVLESLDLISNCQNQLAALYAINGQFPADNAAAGFPEPERIIGNYLKQVEISDGAIHLTLGNKVHPTVMGKIISVRPVYVYESPNSPISWICGHDDIPAGMTVAGEDLTDTPPESLPGRCR
jgi:type IV pilus assembly protein PilA